MEQNRQKHLSWRDGLPTGPDVALLKKAYPSLSPGDRIDYESVSDLLGVPIGSQRFITVTQAWRLREEEKGIVILCERRRAFIVATADHITSRTQETFRHIGRSARKQRKYLGTLAPVDETTRQTVTHHMRLMMAIEQDMKKNQTEMLPNLKSENVLRPLPARVK